MLRRLAEAGRVLVAALANPATTSPASTEASAARVDHRIEQLRDMQWVLRENEARYRNLLDTQADVIVRRQADGRLSFANVAFCRTFGIDAERILGQHFEPVVLDRDPAEPLASVVDKVTTRFNEQLMTVDGPRWFAWEEHRVPAIDGRSLDTQRVGRDITTARLAAEELAKARDQAEAANRAKSRFLAAMSHEIRTPMNGILGMSSLLLDTPLTPEQLTYLRAVDQSAKTLLALIDEILDFSKIEAGKLTLEREPFRLDLCVQGAVELLAPRAHEKDLEIAWTIDPELPSSVVGDEARVRQILLNLIGNAVKFTDRGGVLVRVLSGAADGHLRFTVKDTGPGIAPHALDALFSEFERLESRASRRQDGTGLGLAISKRLARAMDGDITVTSTVGRGATFTAELALPAAPGARVFHRTLPVIVEPRIRRAALAVDRLIERRAIGDMLAAAGVTVEELVIDAAPSAPIDALIVDTEEDPAAAGRLLAQARLIAGGAPVRGIVLIGTSSRSGLRSFRAHGFDSYLVRPVRPQSLVALLGAQATEHRIADAAEDSSSDLPVSRGSDDGPLRVLLAEDNPINALLAVSMLEKEGCTTVVAADGRRAVEAVQASLAAGGLAFDIVLMDVHMPEMDGLEAARVLCEIHGEGHRVPPIVALTANAFPEDRTRCLAAGMSDYLAKPFDRDQLQRTLRRWCDPGKPKRDDRGAAA